MGEDWGQLCIPPVFLKMSDLNFTDSVLQQKKIIPDHFVSPVSPRVCITQFLFQIVLYLGQKRNIKEQSCSCGKSVQLPQWGAGLLLGLVHMHPYPARPWSQT